jgi:pimeloyl-ACP methyl ester carboxylesterase
MDSLMRFRTRELAAEFATAYDAELARWPLPVTPVDVPGEYGTTHVQVCGPTDGTPLVLLHAGGCTSTVWFATVAALGRTHRIYAPDQIGDAGRSVPDGRPVRHLQDLMAWLDGLLAGLGLDAAAWCGHSYGGWLALNHALHAPATVTRLALLDPTNCFAGLRLGYRLHAVPLFARPSARRARAVIEWETGRAPVDESALALQCLGGGEYRGAKIVLPHRPKPRLLQTMEVPTLLLLAERSKAHDIDQVRVGAQRLVPRLTTTVLTGASHHTIPTTNPEQLNRELGAFLT